jgi:hypothetical protein
MGKKQLRWTLGLGWMAAAVMTSADGGCGGQDPTARTGSSSSALTTDPGSSSVVITAPPALVVSTNGVVIVVHHPPSETRPASDSSPDPIPALPTDPDVRADAQDLMKDASKQAAAAKQ